LVPSTAGVQRSLAALRLRRVARYPACGDSMAPFLRLALAVTWTSAALPHIALAVRAREAAASEGAASAEATAALEMVAGAAAEVVTPISLKQMQNAHAKGAPISIIRSGTSSRTSTTRRFATQRNCC